YKPILVAIVQSLVFCAALYYMLANLFAKGYFSFSMCVVAYALALFSPEIFQSNGMVLAESLCASSLLLAAGSIISGFQKKYTVVLFVTGICFLVLTKFEYIAVLPVIFFPLVVTKKYLPLLASVFLLALALSLNAWKNYFLFEKVSPFSFG